MSEREELLREAEEHLSFLVNLPGVHPHRLARIRDALGLAQISRNAVIEECARVAETRFDGSNLNNIAANVAEHIRALKTSTAPAQAPPGKLGCRRCGGWGRIPGLMPTEVLCTLCNGSGDDTDQAASAPAPASWQPIETAPKNKRVLVCVPIQNHRLVIALCTKEGLWLDERMEPMEFIPLDWQPLPAFPVSSTQDHTPRCEHGNPVGVCTVCHMWSQVSSTNCHAPGHTDLMVTPESIDAWLEKNPLSECTCGGEADQPADHHDISCPLAVSPADRVTEA